MWIVNNCIKQHHCHTKKTLSPRILTMFDAPDTPLLSKINMHSLLVVREDLIYGDLKLVTEMMSHD